MLLRNFPTIVIASGQKLGEPRRRNFVSLRGKFEGEIFASLPAARSAAVGWGAARPCISKETKPAKFTFICPPSADYARLKRKMKRNFAGFVSPYPKESLRDPTGQAGGRAARWDTASEASSQSSNFQEFLIK